MTMNKLFLAASLGFVLAACAGEQADTAAVDATAAGEIPQAGDDGIVSGSPEEGLDGNAIGDDAATTADASELGQPMTDPNAPPAVTDPLVDPAQTTDPVLEETDANSTPPPSQ